MPAHGADPRPHRLAVLSCAIFILGVRDLPQAGRLGGRRERPRKADRPWSSGHSFLQPLLRFDELRDWLPKFMYELWMVELASMYGAHGQVWTSHEEYLNSYSTNYSEMWDSFRRIHELASRQGDDDSPPSAEVQTFVKSWRKALSWWQTDQSPRRWRTHPRLRDPRAPVGPPASPWRPTSPSPAPHPPTPWTCFAAGSHSPTPPRPRSAPTPEAIRSALVARTPAPSKNGEIRVRMGRWSRASRSTSRHRPSGCGRC
jgi:hypothetical protein